MKRTNYRVYHKIKVDNDGSGKIDVTFGYYVESPEEGARLISYLCSIENLLPDEVFEAVKWGMEEFKNSRWVEWSTDVFNDIEDLVEFMEDK